MARRARVLAHGRPAACQVQQGVGRNVQRQRGFSRQVLSARSVETGVIVVALRDCHFVDRKIRAQQMIKTVRQMTKDSLSELASVLCFFLSKRFL
jgi:hypothetical protein